MLVRKTLNALRLSGFIDSLYVIVPHDEMAAYIEALKDAPIVCLLQGAERGLVNQRKHARTLFPPGQEMVFIDDDVSSIKLKMNGKFERVGNIHNVVDFCFEWLASTPSLIWGVYPVSNGMFMKERLAIGNCYVVGAFYGIVNDPRLAEPSIDECEDYSRQLSEQAAGRPPLRFEFLGIETRYFKNPGGMQRDRRPENRMSAIMTLVENYPTLVKQKERKDGTPDLKFIQKPEYRPLLMAAHDVSGGQSILVAGEAAETAPHALSGPLPL
ncbi:unannotated protein [freshwater metagenome]|uniref:Unannotated protein n=1 Tax=freshwater metagenome TaxID=449393 RepID=A0A6J7E8K3_9ZZZZ